VPPQPTQASKFAFNHTSTQYLDTQPTGEMVPHGLFIPQQVNYLQPAIKHLGQYTSDWSRAGGSCDATLPSPSTLLDASYMGIAAADDVSNRKYAEVGPFALI